MCAGASWPGFVSQEAVEGSRKSFPDIFLVSLADLSLLTLSSTIE